MKNIVLVLALLLFSFIFKGVDASVILSGDSHTKYGTYQISDSPQSFVLNDIAYKTWELSYSENNEKYIVFTNPGLNGNCCFTVRNDRFEIQYVVNTGKFGVKLVDSEMRTISRKEIMKQMDSDQFASQSLLTSNPKSEEEYLGMIACFMPMLMK